MDFPDETVCLHAMIQCFERLVEVEQYKITSTVCQKHHVKVVYTNAKRGRSIELLNQTNYTDYGFSIFVRSTAEETEQMIVNIPFLKQDRDCRFVKDAAERFFAWDQSMQSDG